MPDDDVRLLCGQCKVATYHDVLYEKAERGDEDWGFWWGKTYRVIQCRGCHDVSFQTEEWNSEDLDHDTGGPDVATRLYPHRADGVSELPSDALTWLPFNLWRLHQEVVRALQAQAGTLAAVGMRALVEALCRDKGTGSGTFAVRVKKLVELGVLPKAHESILLLLRDYGNRAAHEFKQPTHEEQKTLFDITDQLLKTTYYLPHSAKSLQTTPRRTPPAR